MAVSREPARATLPRWSLAALAALHAILLGWAAVTLPWRDLTFFAIATAVVAASHAVTAALAALRHRFLALAWRAQAALSLAYLAFLGWGLLSSAWTIGTMYGGLGRGVAAALGAVFGLVMLLTVPLSVWGLAATGGVRLGRKGTAAAVALALLAGGRLWMLERRAQGAELADASAVRAVQEGAASIDASRLRRPRARRPSLMMEAPVRCSEPLEAARLTLAATFTAETPGSAPEATSHCLQAADPASLLQRLQETLEAQALRGPIKLDLITLRAPLPEDGLLASLAIRPGLDGLCRDDGAGAACFMPWQLVAFDAFSRHQLLASVPDARLGASVGELRGRLEAPPESALYRIATHSLLIDARGELHQAPRSPDPDAQVDADTVAKAARLAQRYIARAQLEDGRFTYLLDPFTGHVEQEPFSVARQAGTTLALCELGQDPRRTVAIARRSLAFLARLERRFGEDRSVLRYPPDTRAAVERIGASALALAAFVRCRPHVGQEHDALIGRLARLLLAQAKPEGGFHHRVHVLEARPEPAPGSLYVDGQAVLALVLVESIATDTAGALPSRAELHEAVEHAMGYFGDEYWDLFVEPFLYMEENWHCIAAAAALSHHRHAAYERFCLDYVSFKSRLVHRGGAPSDFVGGYGFGHLVPPHNTATAGFGEALAAAILVKRARELDTHEEEALLQQVLGFLLRNQWQPESCYACSGLQVVGGFSEHMASPRIRIDYVQHAWAALAHGARALGYAWATELPVERVGG